MVLPKKVENLGQFMFKGLIRVILESKCQWYNVNTTDQGVNTCINSLTNFLSLIFTKTNRLILFTINRKLGVVKFRSCTYFST